MELVIQGIIEVGDIVASTMGPYGKKAILESRNPKIPDVFSRDGVTVADECQNMFSDAHKNIGSRVIVDAARRTVSIAGDGTSSTCAMVSQGMREFLKWQGRQTYSTVRDLLRLRDQAFEQIDAMSKIPQYERFVDAVTVSANNNRNLGQKIADVVWKLGKDAFVMWHPAIGKETTARIDDGYFMRSGAFLPQFIQCPDFKGVVKKGNSIVLKNPYVIVVEEDLERNSDLIPIFKAYRTATSGAYERPLLIIAGQVQEPALRFVLQNLFEGDAGGRNVPAFIVKSPDIGMRRFHILEDIAAVVNTRKVFSKYNGTAVASFKGEKDFGEAEIVEITTASCRIMPKSMNGIADRVKHVKADLDNAQEQVDKGEQPSFDPEFHKARLAALTSGVGVIGIGGYTQSEYNYNSQVVDDAVNAARSILRTGVLPGSGASYLRCIPGPDGYDPMAYAIFARMMKAPREHVCANAGIEISYSEQVFNVVTCNEEDDQETEVLDPTLVATQVIANSISVVSEIIQSKNVITHG